MTPRTPVAIAILAVALVGCSTEPKPAPGPQSAGTPAAESGTGPIGMSPDGVTTRIDVPAQSTEEQYAQACMAAKGWMAAKGGDPDTLVASYLKEIQISTTGGPATFAMTWAELTDAQRSAVIIAVQAAADGGC